MERPGQPNLRPAARYFKLFVNRLAYTVQSPKPDRNWQILLLPFKGRKAVVA